MATAGSIERVIPAIVGASVVLGVLFGQSRQEYGRTKTRATALARDVAVIGAGMLNGLNREGTSPPGEWGGDVLAFGSALLELTDCVDEFMRSP